MSSCPGSYVKQLVSVVTTDTFMPLGYTFLASSARIVGDQDLGGCHVTGEWQSGGGGCSCTQGSGSWGEYDLEILSWMEGAAWIT
jgi:hypothetical protein